MTAATLNFCVSCKTFSFILTYKLIFSMGANVLHMIQMG
jgi:hypothetical protein